MADITASVCCAKAIASRIPRAEEERPRAMAHYNLGVTFEGAGETTRALDSYRAAMLPANLLQAQRDYFGAHTYERIDKPRGEFFHTNWTGRGGEVSSGTYNV